ncbi:MAG: hypothetical protein WBM98_12315 [Maribacter sp.]|uniref:hypothetical protein n=1 Tax=Maribacter sp. TaxID=1897614 RepID=UPI003C7699BA
MGSIAGIFDGAKENIRQGKASIGKSTSVFRDMDVHRYGQEPYNTNDLKYGLNWGSEQSNNGFEVLGNSSADGINTGGMMEIEGHSNATFSWNFPEQQITLERGDVRTLIAQGDSGGSWDLNVDKAQDVKGWTNPFD